MLCLSATRDRERAARVTFWPQISTDSQNDLLADCRAHGGDDGVGHASLLKLGDLGWGKIEVNWRRFDALDS